MRLLLAALLLVACGPEPRYVTAFGVAHFGDSAPSQDDAEAMEAEALRLLASYGEEWSRDCALMPAISGTEVKWLDDAFSCGPTRAMGCQGPYHISVSQTFTVCPFSNAYIHELAHQGQYACGSQYDPDIDHKEVDLWKIATWAHIDLCNRWRRK